MADIPVCPILSVRNTTADELCLQNDCALYLPQAKRCSLVFIGFKAFLEAQKMQGPPQPQQAPPQRPA